MAKISDKAQPPIAPDAEEALYAAILRLKNADDCRRFLHDLCTPAELKALAERWEIARLLQAGNLSYREIREQTGASTTTISRVARFLNHEANQGYRIVLARTPNRKEKK